MAYIMPSGADTQTDTHMLDVQTKTISRNQAYPWGGHTDRHRHTDAQR